jgi:hypothetical protein
MTSRFDEMFIHGIFKYNVPVSKGIAEAVSNVADKKNKYGTQYLKTRGNESGSIRGALASAVNKPGDEVIWDAIFKRKNKIEEPAPDKKENKKKKPVPQPPRRPGAIKPPISRGPIKPPISRGPIKPPVITP